MRGIFLAIVGGRQCLKSVMNSARFQRFLASRRLSDPCVQLLHCKRTLRFLRAAKAGGAHMLILGNIRSHSQVFYDCFATSSSHLTRVTPDLIANATRDYDLILCFDPALYARHLFNINLPRVAICPVEELYRHRDIPDAFDYLVPFDGDQQETFQRLLKSEIDSKNDANVGGF